MLVVLIFRLFELYECAIVLWCVLSWIPGVASWIDTLRDYLGRIVRPFLDPFSNLIPAVGGVDFSPIVAIFVLRLIERIILAIL